jgi:O-antigen/teichoic acid export membrane protein
MMTEKKSGASRDILIYAIGTISRQLVGFLMLPIYTSYLSPSDYGLVSILIVSISVFELVMGARFAQVIPKFYFEEDNVNMKKIVLSSALTTTALLSAIGFLVVYLSRDTISLFFLGDDIYATYLGVFAILLFTNGIESYGLMYLRLMDRPISFVINSLLKLFIQLSLNIYLIIILDYGVIGIIISSVTSSSIFCVYFLIIIYRDVGRGFDLSFIKRLYKFSWPIWLAGTLTLYVHSSDKYFIRVYSSLEDVGLFELAVKFAMIQGVLIWQPFSSWWQSARFKILKTSKSFEQDFQRIFNFLVSFLVTTVMGIIIFSDLIIQFMSSNEFHDATNAVTPLAISLLFLNLSLFFNLSFLASDKTIVLTYLKLISAIVITFLFLVLIPEYGFVGASYAFLITNVVLFLLTYLWGRKYINLGVNLVYFLTLISVALGLATLNFKIINFTTSLPSLLLAKCIIFLIFLIFIAVMLLKNQSTSSDVQLLVRRFIKRKE